jgi:hypothetical protein
MLWRQLEIQPGYSYNVFVFQIRIGSRDCSHYIPIGNSSALCRYVKGRVPLFNQLNLKAYGRVVYMI